MTAASRQLTVVASRVVPLLADDVDTDQIIPARFLKVTDKEGLKDGLFAEWRSSPDFVLNRSESSGASILLAGRNFGCGSSREHAAWALASWGFRVVIARSFGDIFRNNAYKNALLPIALPEADHARVVKAVAADPGAELTVDLRDRSVRLPDGGRLSFEVDGFAADCLLRGVDQLGYLQSFDEAITEYEERREGQQA